MNRIAASLLVSLLFPVVASAEVLVAVKIDSKAMMGRYTPRTAEVERAIASEIARRLPRYFRHWSYASAASVTTQDYALSFRIHKRGGDQVVTMSMTAKDEIGGTWDAVWMPAGELAARGFPDRSLAGVRVATEIAEILLDQKQQEITSRMKQKVPVATAAQWQRVIGRSDSPRLVVPLRWPESQSFVNSKFRVKCDWPGKGPAELQTTALNEAADYDDAISRSSYKALTLKPLMRIFERTSTPVGQVARELRKLKPIVVYLEDDDPMGLHIAGEQQ
jgi:hypothetical protein